MARVAKDVEFVEPTSDAPKKKPAPKRRPKAPKLEEPIQVTPTGLDPDKLLLADIDTTGGPLFSVLEASKAFKFNSEHWLRLQETSGYFTFNGNPIEVKRSAHNARQFSLSDIEKIAHGLAQNHRITGQHAVLILQTVAVMAKLHGYLPSDD